MAALLSHVSGMLADPFSGRVEHGLDFVALGKLHEDLDRWDEAARLYERGLESNLTEADFWVAVRRLSILQKRRGDIAQALHWWEQAAENGHLYACIELAKYHEHKLRDTRAALNWTRAARERAAAQEMPAYMRQHWLDEIDRRLARLERKLGAAPGPHSDI
jgi:TPR repeat protein